VSNDSANMNRKVAARRKAAKRTNPFDLEAEELHEHLMSPSLSPQEDEDIPAARKKPRLEVHLPTATDKAARQLASPDLSGGLPPADADNDVNADLVTDTQPNAGATRMTGQWTSEEDAKLTSAVANTPKKKWGTEYKINWDAVAALVPGRTKTQCQEKWYRGLNPNSVRATGRKCCWTADDDKKLKGAVLTHDGKNWAAIAALVPCRTKFQCRNRWHNDLKPSITLTTGSAGTWTVVEDIELEDSVQLHGGKDWAAIAALVPSRTKRQCQNRWYRVLDPSIVLTNGRAGKWSEDEVTKLKDAVLTHGGKNWKKIAALVPDRTIRQCCDKWKEMEPDRCTVREKESSTLKKAPACEQDPHLTHDEFIA
jgi:hypothetical protein